jgi:anti-sigma B factor antagonist
MSDLNITTRQSDGITILDLDGRIALGETSAKLHESIRSLAAEGKKKILLNLQRVTGIDSSGLGSLVAGHATMEKNGGAISLVNLSDRTTELMTITKLYTVFDIFDDEQTALASFAKGGSEAAAV